MKQALTSTSLGKTALFFLMVLMVSSSLSLTVDIGSQKQNALDEGNLNELAVKAAFLEKFTRFIEWPKGTNMKDTAKPFVIGVFGKTPLTKQLEIDYAQKTIKRKKVEIRTISTIEEIPGCHILFIPRSAKSRLPIIRKFVKNKAVLTMSDTRGFARWGVHISLFIKRNSIEFNINESEIKMSGLKVSYHLKKQASKIFDQLQDRK